MLNDIFIYLVWIIVLAICALFSFLARRAYRGDLSNGRRRCPKCWFDMSRSPSLTCSECGHTALFEKDLFRARRHPFRAALALLTIVAIIIAVNFQLSSRRWTSFLPTGLLISFLPAASGPSSDIYRELLLRISSNRLTNQQFLAFVNRIATGDYSADPPSDAWIAKYGDILNAGRIRGSADPSVIAALDAIPPRIDLTARSPWPAGVEPVLALRMRDWWSLGYECRLTIQPSSADSAMPQFLSAAFIRRPNDFFAPTLPITLPALPPGKHRLNMNIRIERRRVAPPNAPTDDSSPSDSADPDVSDPPISSDPWQLVTALDLPLDLQIQSPEQVAIVPASSAELTAAIRQVFQAGVTKWPNGPSPVRFFFDPSATFVPAFADTAVGARLELRRDTALARRLDLWWVAGPQTPDRAVGWMASLEDIQLLSQLSSDDSTWSLTVTGDPALALRAGNASKYWSGSFTLPVLVRLRQESAPPRAWTTDPSNPAPLPEAR